MMMMTSKNNNWQTLFIHYTFTLYTMGWHKRDHIVSSDNAEKMMMRRPTPPQQHVFLTELRDELETIIASSHSTASTRATPPTLFFIFFSVQCNRILLFWCSLQLSSPLTFYLTDASLIFFAVTVAPYCLVLLFERGGEQSDAALFYCVT